MCTVASALSKHAIFLHRLCWRGLCMHAAASLPRQQPCSSCRRLNHHRVRVPTFAVILRADSTTAVVYALLGSQARAAVDAARAHRKRLADNRVLKGLMAIMPAVDAEALGIKVLRKDDVGNMAVGMFDVPALSAVIAEPPKSACSRACSAAAAVEHAAGCLTVTFPSRAEFASSAAAHPCPPCPHVCLHP